MYVLRSAAPCLRQRSRASKTRHKICQRRSLRGAAPATSSLVSKTWCPTVASEVSWRQTNPKLGHPRTHTETKTENNEFQARICKKSATHIQKHGRRLLPLIVPLQIQKNGAAVNRRRRCQYIYIYIYIYI